MRQCVCVCVCVFSHVIQSLAVGYYCAMATSTATEYIVFYTQPVPSTKHLSSLLTVHFCRFAVSTFFYALPCFCNLHRVRVCVVTGREILFVNYNFPFFSFFFFIFGAQNVKPFRLHSASTAPTYICCSTNPFHPHLNTSFRTTVQSVLYSLIPPAAAKQSNKISLVSFYHFLCRFNNAGMYDWKLL